MGFVVYVPLILPVVWAAPVLLDRGGHSWALIAAGVAVPVLVAAGRVWLTRQQRRRLRRRWPPLADHRGTAGPRREVAHSVGRSGVLLSPPGDLRGLTVRQLEVLGLLVRGESNARIAAALSITERTVAHHVEHVLTKLDASSRTAAVRLRPSLGLYVPLDPGADRQRIG